MTQTDFDLNDYLAEKRRLIDAELERLLQLPQVPARLADAMRYSVTAGGKRLRPILCLAAADAIGETDADLLPIACAVELIHTYSLIHDDLPAMDNDALRRGKPTCHVAFDEATAILAGDALLTLAFGILSEIGKSDPQKATACLQVIEIIADAAGGSGMVGGQMLDMSAEGRPVSLTDLQTLQQMKTGALIRAAVCAGSIAAGASAAQIESLDMYAVNIGLAFQIADDVLNV